MGKKYFIKQIVVLSFIILSGCKNIINISVEKEQIIGFNIIEVYGNEFNYIQISGLIGASSYNYKKIEIIKENQIIKILLYGELVVLNKNGSGNFEINIPLDKDINKVYFGNNNDLIWEKNLMKY